MGWWGGDVPMPHPDSHRNLRQTLSSSASAGKPFFLPEGLPHCPVSLAPYSSSQQTPGVPLTSSWEVASSIPPLSWGGAVFSPQTHSPCGMFLPGCHLFYTLQTNVPALLRVLLSITWAEHLLYVNNTLNNTCKEYTGIYRI